MQLHEGGVSALRKLKVYLDTSIVSYLDQQDAPDKMNETLRLWELFVRKSLMCISLIL